MDYEQKYEQKYREALGWMRSLYDGLHGATKEDAEHYFPELKENKSERVRKGLIKTISSLLDNTILYHTDITKEEALAWLEKQSEQKHFSVFKAKDWYVSKVDGKIHNMTYNPTDKVEPKFKIGNWITDGRLTCKVLSVTGKSYELHLHNDDYCHFETDVQSVDKRYHLWTIQDAMDGDVLVHNGYPFIFMGIKDGIVQALEENLLEGTNPVNFGEPKIDKDYHPATKEQRDVLFAKMKEAGYEWNNDKKELNKIEQKNPIVNVPPRELILSIWDLGNEWKELTNGSISTEYGTQLEYIQKHWQESSYYDNIGDNIPTLTDKDYDKLFINCKH